MSLIRQTNTLTNEPMAECRPDPEDMLQRARKHVENYEKAKAMFLELADMPVDIIFGNDNYLSVNCAMGSLELGLIQARRDVEYWLEEINKG